MWTRRHFGTSPSRQYSQAPQPQDGFETTRSPTRGRSTPGPTDATTPATSPPVMWGSGVGSPGMPSRVKMSSGLSAQAWTRTTISPGPATGSGQDGS